MTETIIRRAEDSPSVAAELDHGAEWTARQAAAPLKAMGENVTIQKNWQ